VAGTELADWVEAVELVDGPELAAEPLELMLVAPPELAPALEFPAAAKLSCDTPSVFSH